VSPPKAAKSRGVIYIDVQTVAVLRQHRREHGLLALPPPRAEAKAFDTEDDEYRHPERFSRLWNQTVARAVKAGVDVPPIWLHDLRHTHATVLLQAGVPVKVVSERLGHALSPKTGTLWRRPS
jgi:integrase